MADRVRKAAVIALILVCVVVYAIAFALYGRTLVEWWKPWSVAIAVALLSGAVMWRWWRKLTQWAAVWINGLCHVVFVAGLCAAVIFGVNIVGADDTTDHFEHVTVVKKYCKEHHRPRRVGRRYITTGGTPWYDYHMDVRFSDGRIKRLSIPQNRYNRLRTGSTITLHLRRGALFMPVIR